MKRGRPFAQALKEKLGITITEKKKKKKKKKEKKERKG